MYKYPFGNFYTNDFQFITYLPIPLLIHVLPDKLNRDVLHLLFTFSIYSIISLIDKY